MSLHHHNVEAAATATMQQSLSLRDKLLHELDELEVALRGVREVAEQLPPELGINGRVPKTVSETEVKVTRRKFRLWNK